METFARRLRSHHTWCSFFTRTLEASFSTRAAVRRLVDVVREFVTPVPTNHKQMDVPATKTTTMEGEGVVVAVPPGFGAEYCYWGNAKWCFRRYSTCVPTRARPLLPRSPAARRPPLRRTPRHRIRSKWDCLQSRCRTPGASAVPRRIVCKAMPFFAPQAKRAFTSFVHRLPLNRRWPPTAALRRT